MNCDHKKLLHDCEAAIRDTVKMLQLTRQMRQLNRFKALWARLRECLKADEIVVEPPKDQPLPSIFVKGRRGKREESTVA